MSAEVHASLAGDRRHPISEDDEAGTGDRARDRLRERVHSSRPQGADATGLLSAVCLVATAELHVDGAAVLLFATATSGTDEPAVVAAASGDDARQVLDLELGTGEGPGRTASALRRPVLTPDLAHAHGRWPGYATAAVRAGVCAVFAIPLHVGAMRLGVLVAYRSRPGSLARAEVATLTMLAELATDILLDRDLPGAVSPDPSGFLGGLPMADEVYQAQGMMMAALDVSLSAALAILRARAFADDRTLRDLADDVVHGRVVLPDHFQDGQRDAQ